MAASNAGAHACWAVVMLPGNGQLIEVSTLREWFDSHQHLLLACQSIWLVGAQGPALQSAVQHHRPIHVAQSFDEWAEFANREPANHVCLLLSVATAYTADWMTRVVEARSTQKVDLGSHRVLNASLKLGSADGLEREPAANRLPITRLEQAALAPELVFPETLVFDTALLDHFKTRTGRLPNTPDDLVFLSVCEGGLLQVSGAAGHVAAPYVEDRHTSPGVACGQQRLSTSRWQTWQQIAQERLALCPASPAVDALLNDLKGVLHSTATPACANPAPSPATPAVEWAQAQPPYRLRLLWRTRSADIWRHAGLPALAAQTHLPTSIELVPHQDDVAQGLTSDETLRAECDALQRQLGCPVMLQGKGPDQNPPCDWVLIIDSAVVLGPEAAATALAWCCLTQSDGVALGVMGVACDLISVGRLPNNSAAPLAVLRHTSADATSATLAELPWIAATVCLTPSEPFLLAGRFLPPFELRLAAGVWDPTNMAVAPSFSEWLSLWVAQQARHVASLAASQNPWVVVIDVRSGDAGLDRTLRSLRDQHHSPLNVWCWGQTGIALPAGCRKATHADDWLSEAATLDPNTRFMMLAPGDVLLPGMMRSIDQRWRDGLTQWAYVDHVEAEAGTPTGIHLKPDFAPLLFCQSNAVSRAGIYTTALLKEVPAALFELGLLAISQGLALQASRRVQIDSKEPQNAVLHSTGAWLVLDSAHPIHHALTSEDWQQVAQASQHISQATAWQVNWNAGPAPGLLRPVPATVTSGPLIVIMPADGSPELLGQQLEAWLRQEPAAGSIHVWLLCKDTESGSGQKPPLAWLEQLPNISDGRIQVLPLASDGPSELALLAELARHAAGCHLLWLPAVASPAQERWWADVRSWMQLPGLAADVLTVATSGPDGVSTGGPAVLGLGGLVSAAFAGLPSDAPGYFFRHQLAQEVSGTLSMGPVLLAADWLNAQLSEPSASTPLPNTLHDFLEQRPNAHRIWLPCALRWADPASASVDLSEPSPGPVGTALVAQPARQAGVRRDPMYSLQLAARAPGFELETSPLLAQFDEPIANADITPRLAVFPADLFGCGHYRIIQPFQAMRDEGLAHGGIGYEFLAPHHLLRSQAQSAVFQRPASDRHIELLESILPLNSIFKVFEIDDLLHKVPMLSVHRSQMPVDMQKRLQRSIALCDRLVVTSDYLAEQYARHAQDVRVIGNALPPRWWGHTPLVPRQDTWRPGSAQRPVIGWAGSISHGGDLVLLKSVLKALAPEVDFEFFGFCPEELRPYVKAVYAGIPTVLYPAKLMSISRRWDLAIAPIEDNPFNRAKSNLKLLEYGWCGLPVVCSNVGPYRDKRFTVTRLENKSQRWIDALRDLLHAPEERLKLAGNLQQEVLAHGVLNEERLLAWRAAWLP